MGDDVEEGKEELAHDVFQESGEIVKKSLSADGDLPPFSIVPDSVLYGEGIAPQEAKLYALILSLSRQKGFCYASNDYLAQKMGCYVKRVSAWLTKLKEHGLITASGRSYKRRLAIADKDGLALLKAFGNLRSSENETSHNPRSSENATSQPYNSARSRENETLRSRENETQNIISINKYISPPLPPKGERERISKNLDDEERKMFSELLELYPHSHRGNRKDAAKEFAAIPNVVNEWPAIKSGLEQWLSFWEQHGKYTEQGGRFVPTLKKWLHDRQWERMSKQPPASRPIQRKLTKEEARERDEQARAEIEAAMTREHEEVI